MNVNKLLFKDYTFIQEKQFKQRREKMKGLINAVVLEINAYDAYQFAQAEANKLRADWKKKHDYLHTIMKEEQQK